MNAANDPVFADVELEQPIVRGDQTIDRLKIRRPTAGELRGLSLVDTGQLQVDALMKLIPRLAEPKIAEGDVAGMIPSDLLAIGAEIGNFLLPKRLRPASPSA